MDKPTKLDNLKITSVSFVDEGANPDADILLYKNKEGVPVEKNDAGKPKSNGGLLKRVFCALAKAMGADGSETKAALKELAESPDTFNEKMAERNLYRIKDEIWDVVYALQESFASILNKAVAEEDGTDTEALMNQSLQEFTTAVTAAIPKWAGGNVSSIEKRSEITPERIEMMRNNRDHMSDIIAKYEEEHPVQSGKTENGATGEVEKGANTEMNIDKSKLTESELAFLEAIEKKCGGEREKAKGEETEPETSPKKKPEKPDVGKGKTAEPEHDDGDIYKNLHPAIQKELEDLRKRADAAEEKELYNVAKKYELLGKSADELVPIFKSLKAADGDAYNQMISVLDANLAAMEKSGMFEEIGKSGSASAVLGSWEAIEKHADEIMKSAPSMNRAVAIEKACELHPELVHEYEAGR